VFPLAHLFFARQVLGSLDGATALGAVVPDVLAAGGSGWNATHSMGLRLYEGAVIARDMGHLDGELLVRFARSALTHGADPPGLDYYGDLAYEGHDRGFAYLVARPLADRVAAACGVPPDLGWWKAHNFVEMAIELVVDAAHPELGASLQRALELREPAATVVSLVDEVLALPPGGAAACFARFPSFLTLERLTPQRLAQTYQIQMRAKHGVVAIDVVASAQIIVEAVELVRPVVDEFFAVAAEGVTRLLARHPG
jgi:hypothetical protein